MQKKPTLDEYKEFGRELKELQNRLVKLEVELANKTGKTKKPREHIRNAVSELRKATAEAEELMFLHYPELGDEGLNIFYGKAEEGEIQNVSE